MDKEQFTLMDILNILSFYIGLKNLNVNLSQDVAGNMLKIAVEDIHNHLKEQDDKLERLEALLNDQNKEISQGD